MNSLKKLNYGILLIFLAIYPFLIKPFGTIYYATMSKLVYLTFTVLLIWIFIIYNAARKRKLSVKFQSTGERLALAFLFLILIATIFSYDPYISYIGSMQKLNGFISWFGYISLFIFAYHFIPVVKQIIVIKVMVYGSFIVALYGILQHHFPEVLTGGETRSWAFFDHANHLGSYINIMLILGMTLFLMTKSKIELYIYGTINSVLFIAVLYTTTRSAWLSIFITAILLSVFVVWKRRQLWNRWFFLLGTLFILLIVVNFTENSALFGRIESISNDVGTIITKEENRDSAGSGRWGIWKRALILAGDHPILGTGPSTFTEVFPLNKWEKAYGLDNSHNDYVEIVYSMGIPALLLYLGFMAFIIGRGFLIARKLDEDNQLFHYGILITIVGYLIKTFFNISVIPVAPFFWVLLGICYSLITVNKSISSKQEIGNSSILGY